MIPVQFFRFPFGDFFHHLWVLFAGIGFMRYVRLPGGVFVELVLFQKKNCLCVLSCGRSSYYGGQASFRVRIGKGGFRVCVLCTLGTIESSLPLRFLCLCSEIE
jgi:hypothetical protein